jgi:hypothetical protein
VAGEVTTSPIVVTRPSMNRTHDVNNECDDAALLPLYFEFTASAIEAGSEDNRDEYAADEEDDEDRSNGRLSIRDLPIPLEAAANPELPGSRIVDNDDDDELMTESKRSNRVAPRGPADK